MTAIVWKNARRALQRSRRALRDGDADGLHDFRVALRRLATVARAAGRGKIARDARRIAVRFSRLRQLEVDRLLLASLVDDGLLSASAATTIDERLRLEIARRLKKADRTLEGRRLRRLLRRLRKKNAGSDARLRRKLRRTPIQPLALPSGGLDDETLHRLRLQIKRARYRMEVLRGLGEKGLEESIGKLRFRQDRLGEFNDRRLFGKDLRNLRRAAAAEGAVSQVANIDAALDLLRPRILEARSAAIASLPAASGPARPAGSRASF